MTAAEVLQNIYDIYITDRSDYDDAPKCNPIDFRYVEEYVDDFKEFTEFCLNADESDILLRIFYDEGLVNGEEYEKLKSWGYNLADGVTPEEFNRFFALLCDKLEKHWEDSLFSEDRYAFSISKSENKKYLDLYKFCAAEQNVKMCITDFDVLAHFRSTIDFSSIDNLFYSLYNFNYSGKQNQIDFKNFEISPPTVKADFVEKLYEMDNDYGIDTISEDYSLPRTKAMIMNAIRYELFSYKKEKGIENAETSKIRKTRDRIIIDTETTGFSRETDEILQLFIIDVDTKEVLFDEYFKPEWKQSWSGAEAVNHISPEMVADKPSIFDRLEEIQEIIASADTVIVYNSAFDVDFLEHYGVDFSTNVIDDPMCYGAVLYGDTKAHNDEDGEPYITYKWKKLGVLAEHLGYEGDGWHNSTADCIATAYVYEKIREPENLKKYWINALTHSDYLEDERFVPAELREDYKTIVDHKDKTVNAFIESLSKSAISETQRNRLTKSVKNENKKSSKGMSL